MFTEYFCGRVEQSVHWMCVSRAHGQIITSDSNDTDSKVIFYGQDHMSKSKVTSCGMDAVD